MEQNGLPAEVNFTIMILGTNRWPQTPPDWNFTIPSQLIPLHDRFSGKSASCLLVPVILIAVRLINDLFRDDFFDDIYFCVDVS